MYVCMYVHMEAYMCESIHTWKYMFTCVAGEHVSDVVWPCRHIHHRVILCSSIEKERLHRQTPDLCIRPNSAASSS